MRAVLGSHPALSSTLSGHAPLKAAEVLEELVRLPHHSGAAAPGAPGGCRARGCPPCSRRPAVPYVQAYAIFSAADSAPACRRRCRSHALGNDVVQHPACCHTAVQPEPCATSS
jgi:hypothetical protein